MTKRVYILRSKKGGVGKSTTSRALLDIWRSSGVRVAAYDADGEVGQLLKFYGQRGADGSPLAQQDPLVGVDYFDVRDDNARDRLIEFTDLDADIVLVDLPGGATGELNKVVPGGLPALCGLYREYGWEPYIIEAMTPIDVCADSAIEFIEECAGHANLIVAKNGPADSFFLFDGDGGVLSEGNGRKMLLEAGGQEFLIPQMRWRSYIYVDAHQLPFSAAADPKRREHRQYRGDQLWVRQWLEDFRSEMGRLGMLDHAKDAVA